MSWQSRAVAVSVTIMPCLLSFSAKFDSSGIGSLEEEDWKECADAAEEEDESMVEEGFSVSSTEEGDEEASCSTFLNKRGYSGDLMPRWFSRTWCRIYQVAQRS